MIIIDRLTDISIEELCTQLFEVLDESYEFGSPWTLTQLEQSLANDSNHFYYLVEGMKIIGFVQYTYLLDQADIVNFALSPDYQKKGLAGKLIQVLQEELRKKKVIEIFLEVRKSNTHAQHFYEKHGFSQIGLRKNYYHNPQEDAYLYKGELL